jgi:hypothetical protein
MRDEQRHKFSQKVPHNPNLPAAPLRGWRILDGFENLIYEGFHLGIGNIALTRIDLREERRILLICCQGGEAWGDSHDSHALHLIGTTST